MPTAHNRKTGRWDAALALSGLGLLLLLLAAPFGTVRADQMTGAPPGAPVPVLTRSLEETPIGAEPEPTSTAAATDDAPGMPKPRASASATPDEAVDAEPTPTASPAATTSPGLPTPDEASVTPEAEASEPPGTSSTPGPTGTRPAPADVTPTITGTPTAMATPSPTGTSQPAATPGQALTLAPAHSPAPSTTLSATPTASPTPVPSATPGLNAALTATPHQPALASAPVVINEIVTDPQLDWGGGGFSGVPGGGLATAADEWIELYVHTSGLNLSGWTIELHDTSPTAGDLTASGAFQVSRYFGSGSFGNTVAGDYVVLGNPRGSMNNTILVVLKDAGGALVDKVQIGDGGAPDGQASGPLDEAIARVPNGFDTDDDIADFTKQAASLGAPNIPGALPVPTATPGPYPFLAVLINEVAWAGTAASSNHEWIELHNPSQQDVPLAGWTLTDGGDVAIAFTQQIIAAGGYLLLERTSDNSVSDIAADLIYTGALNDAGETLSLRDAYGNLIDTANAAGGPWPAGGGALRASMERLGTGPDVPGNWHSNSGLAQAGLDANGQPLRGTARAENSPPAGTLPTATPTATPTASPAPPPVGAGMLINEFLPRPGAGSEEFIELINLSGGPADLSGWRLDDAPGGSAPYVLPLGTIVEHGGLLVFYRSATGVSLNDDGDSVRLLRPDGRVEDERSYSRAPGIDISWARVPDGGAWHDRGQPTPGGYNQLIPGPVEPDELPIATFRDWPDGAWVVVRAPVSVPPRIFSARTVQVQDETGGVTLYLGRNEWPNLPVGRSVRVLGMLRRRNGNLEVYVRNGWHVAAGPEDALAPPAARRAPTGELGEASEGWLMTVTGRVVRLETSAIWIDDGSGPARVFFSAAAGLSRPPVQRGETWRVTGVVVEYTIATSSAPRYRLQPRDTGDFVRLSGPGVCCAPVTVSDDEDRGTPQPTETAQP
jgi:hypothetical protein